nr:mediator of RNA polymerase II transcription subunit 15 isoform X3 [Ipomoea batatas]
MFPPHNSQSRPSSQLHSNGLPASAPLPQVMSNPGMQIQPPAFNPQGLMTPNTHPRFPFQGPQNPNNQINNVFPQMPGQFFPQNAVNPAQFFNPNGVGVQNPAFTGNLQFTQQPMNGNFLNQSQQGNAPPMNAFGMVPLPHLNQSSLNHPDAAKSQGDLGQAARGDTKGNWKSSPNNNFKRNQRHDAPHTGFRKAVPQSVQNAKRNFNNHNDSLRKELQILVWFL